ncbi:DUF5988 family protein [Nocardia sp. NBC_00565]|uniref:DUF5988 family protein n=1 Tax=Nocardia sp. NBC_00565 TaxID=2975993 RepID=UPI003FA5E457
MNVDQNRVHEAVAPEGTFPIVVLTDGPPGLPRIVSVSNESSLSERITIDHHSRHLHFEATGEVEVVDGHVVPVFHWSYTTCIAE